MIYIHISISIHIFTSIQCIQYFNIFVRRCWPRRNQIVQAQFQQKLVHEKIQFSDKSILKISILDFFWIRMFVEYSCSISMLMNAFNSLCEWLTATNTHKWCFDHKHRHMRFVYISERGNCKSGNRTDSMPKIVLLYWFCSLRQSSWRRLEKLDRLLHYFGANQSGGGFQGVGMKKFICCGVKFLKNFMNLFQINSQWTPQTMSLNWTCSNNRLLLETIISIAALNPCAHVREPDSLNLTFHFTWMCTVFISIIYRIFSIFLHKLRKSSFSEFLLRYVWVYRSSHRIWSRNEKKFLHGDFTVSSSWCFFRTFFAVALLRCIEILQ